MGKRRGKRQGIRIVAQPGLHAHRCEWCGNVFECNGVGFDVRTASGRRFLRNCSESTCSRECRTAQTRNIFQQIPAMKVAMEHAARNLHNAIARFVQALRRYELRARASVPMEVDTGDRHLRIGELHWDGWDMHFIEHEKCHPIASCQLSVCAEAAHHMEELLEAIVDAEDVLEGARR